MIRFLARGLLFPLMALLLASCDSGNDQVNVPGLSTFTLSVQTVSVTTGLPATQTSAAAPLRVVATLTSPAGAPVPGATIEFTSRLAAGGTPVVTTAQTDGAGVATVTLNAGTTTTPGVAQAGSVTVRFVAPDTNVATDSQNYTTLGDENTSGGGGGGPAPTNVLRMTLAAIDGTGGIITASNPVSSTNPGRLSVLVTLDGVPVPNALVSFSSPSIATLSQSSAATNASGVAEVTVTAISNGAGVASAVASVGSQQVSASVVVSTSITATAPVTLALGSISGATFTSGTLLSSAVAAISSGSTITISADVVNAATNVPYDTPVTLTFSSSCAALGTAEIDASASTVSGHAIVTYRPTSCGGNDTITATLRDGARTVTATVTVNILAPVIGQVAFVSATPTSIALAGTGGLGRLTRSEVLFRVLSSTGSPIANQLVCFGLSTSVGGLAVNANTRSNSTGDAIAAVQAGSIPTSVRVQATVDSDNDNNCATVPSPAQSAVSDALSVSTGLPDQNSLSLSFSTFNPLAWETDGTAVTVTVRSADHFNNPVPDGTAISFWSELGSIQPSCTTFDGTCSVTWRSQNPRGNRDPRAGATIGVNQTVGRAINDRLGRSTIVAYAVGEESFNDADGDGRFDVGEGITDLAEVIKDSNENGARDQPGLALNVFEDEEFVDFNRNSANDPANGRYDGVLCAVAGAACSGDATVNVRDSGVIVMSSRNSRAYVLAPGTFDPSVIDYAADGSMTGLPAQISSISLGGATASITLVVTDQNGNAPPAGSTISAALTDGKTGTVVGGSSFTVPSQTEFYLTGFTVKAPDDMLTARNGSLIITMDSGGVTSTIAVISVSPF